LLWAVPNSAQEQLPVAATHTFYTIGTATSPLPTAGMIHLMALLATQEIVADALTRVKEVPKTADNALLPPNARATLIADLLNNATSLHEAVPPPPPVRLRRTAPRWWRTTANPVQILLAHTHRQQQPDRTAAREARRLWLTTQLATWSAAFAADNQANEQSAQIGPFQLLPEVTLEQMRQQILTAAQSIEEELAAVTAAAEHQEQRLQAHRQSVGNFCATLPTLTIEGLLFGIRQPSRWLRWTYQLTVGLSQQLRLLSQQLSTQQQILHDEANLHLRRQLALAMLQDVQQLLTWRRELATHLAALQRYLDAQLTEALDQLSIRLDRQQSERLYRRLLHDGVITRQAGVRALAALLHPAAADEWLDGSPALIGETLLDEFMAAFTPLASWSVDEWFAAAFVPSASADHQRPDVDAPGRQALIQWLNQLAEAVSRLWPEATGPSAQPTTHAECWLYWPEQPTTTFEPEEWQPADAVPVAIEQWLENQSTATLCRGTIPAVIIVQRLGLTDL
ncbi:MAG: hypothetical protein KDE58_22760, partial [Caldilineaceae bacterium]|nr:hypothetical protein [Caldilineaceae bacterium]